MARVAGRFTAALVTALAAVLLPGPAPAAAAEPCVGVIVDARLLGGEVRTGCALGDPDSGLQALTRAGFSYSFVPRQPGLVCQIDRLPECSRTTTTTYWSYWYRAKGSSTWTYATQGAGSHDPAPGSTEAWVWQEGGRREPPSIGLREICPQAFASPTTSTTPGRPTSSNPSTRSSRSPAPSGDPANSTTAARTTTSQAATVPSAKASTTSAPPTTAATTVMPTSQGARTTSASQSPTPLATGPADREGDRPPVGLALGAALVAALGGAAAVRARRRGGPT